MTGSLRAASGYGRAFPELDGREEDITGSGAPTYGAGSNLLDQAMCASRGGLPGQPDEADYASYPDGCWYEYGGTKPCWDADNSSSTTPLSKTFGTSCAGCTFAAWEKTLFAHKIAPGHTGQMTHFWSTCDAQCEGALRVRYYIDGEENASIVYEPGMAAGSGFDDPAAPWGVSAASKQSLPCL